MKYAKSRIASAACLALALVGVGFQASAASNTASATASATATVVKPITLTKSQDLNFGSFTADSASAGTVSISAASVRGSTGGVVLLNSGTTPGAAIFSLNGDSAATFTLTVPSSATLTSGANTMTVALSNDAPSTLTGSAQTFHVYGALTVAANQVAGTYTNAAAIPITATYN